MSRSQYACRTASMKEEKIRIADACESWCGERRVLMKVKCTKVAVMMGCKSTSNFW